MKLVPCFKAIPERKSTLYYRDGYYEGDYYQGREKRRVLDRFVIDPQSFYTNRPSGDDWLVVTTHFNPCKYSRLRETYYEWLPSVSSVADRVRCYELVLDDDDPEIEGSIVVRGYRDRHYMWQKEALLNRALRETDAKYFAWVDHDLLFENPNWLVDGIRQIKCGAVAAQLFDSLSWTDSTKRVIEWRASGMSNNGKGCPGGAWIGDTAFLKSIGGFELSNIFGGGDQTFYDVMVSKPGWHLCQYPKAMTDIITDWIWNAIEKKKGRGSSFIKGRAYHLFHGTRKNRQYANRYDVLTEKDFDPTRDLFVNSDGLVEWVDSSNPLKGAVQQFFLNRKEDEEE